MSFKTINIKACYETGIDDLVGDFYIPVLSNAVHYDRITGFFTSTSLAISAKGILGLILNNGKMRLISSPTLTSSDVEIIENNLYEKDSILRSSLEREILNIKDEFIQNHLFALGWLLKNGLLDIRLALVRGKDGRVLNKDQIVDSGIFHQKVGVLRDAEGNIISFSGSINETAKGWLENIEEFKVFKNWEHGQREFCQADIIKFDTLWNSKREDVRIVNLPDAIKDQLIKNVPNDLTDILGVKKYREYQKKSRYAKIEDLSLFDYQQEALNKWLDNDKKLIFEMATGTGKTRTAISCIIKALEEGNSTIIVIACPQNTLLLQWKDEIEKLRINYDSSIIVDGTNPNWRLDLENKLLDIGINAIKNLILYTTHATCSSLDFRNIIEAQKRKSKIFFIGDEVHGLGAAKTRNSLVSCYDYRLGLSATPRRWYDEEGTDLLYDYFGNSTFEFSLRDALTTTNPLTNKPYLVNYYYHPIFTTLTEPEVDKYIELTKKITKLSKFSKKNDQYAELLENLIFKRADIHKSAENKYQVLDDLLGSTPEIMDMIIFVSPEQIRNVLSIINSREIRTHEFTEKQGTTPKKEFNGKTERQYIVEKFKEGKYQILVAIKCLDEGIDIPSAKTAILLASSTNPREYVQRLGRILRQSPEKTFAHIYDVIIKPDVKNFNEATIGFEKMVFGKEMVRALEIAENAINNAEACKLINSVL